MPRYHLAQLNIAQMQQPLESPAMADFVANLPRINALAEASAGFLWRLQDEAEDANVRLFGDRVLVNLSLWQSVEALRDYVYQSAHGEILRRRAELFERMDQAHMVLWWVPAGHLPALGEAAERLHLLRETGASAQAFTLRQVFQAPALSTDALAPP